MLAALVAGMALLLAPLWLGALLLVAILAVILHVLRGRPSGALRALPLADDGLRWEWCDPGDTAWRPVTLRCDYLGPWLIGLRLDARRLWLWPDSSSAASLWQLRRLLVQQRSP
ncbi:hypothetical protein [Halomonas mongoliensis]|uniref:hypothetical protein n=1 Tax=Halomonas mongoliensis TaxID=321265 RepID=UPI00403AA451